jgi:hypothetical protein
MNPHQELHFCKLNKIKGHFKIIVNHDMIQFLKQNSTSISEEYRISDVFACNIIPVKNSEDVYLCFYAYPRISSSFCPFLRNRKCRKQVRLLVQFNSGKGSEENRNNAGILRDKVLNLSDGLNIVNNNNNKRKMLVVINPKSGTGKGVQIFKVKFQESVPYL